MKSAIKIGTVFAGKKSPNVHNEITRVYTDDGVKMVEVEQYGATLANKDHSKTVFFTESEVRYMLRNGFAHLILVRDAAEWQNKMKLPYGRGGKE